MDSPKGLPAGNLPVFNYQGRPPGTLNRRTKDLYRLVKEMGIDPFQFLMDVVKGDWKAIGYEKPTRTIVVGGQEIEVPVIDLEVRVKAAKEACQYLYPRRKAVELSTEGGAPFIAIEKPDGTKMIMGARPDLESKDE